ncbi:hypothetical protein ABZP36_008242 [Zizania latifolia]
MMSSAPETFSLDHHLPQQQQPPLAEQEQLCYVHCNFCDTILADEVPFQAPPSVLTEQASPNVSSITSSNSSCANTTPATSMASAPKAAQRQPQPPKSASSANRTSEKRQRVPSAYNRFIKDEIQRIKASNPDITHREAFSAAAKNWAHFPHIHFGLMPDQGLKKTGIQSQDGAGECILFKDGLYAAAAAAASSMGVTPF